MSAKASGKKAPAKKAAKDTVQPVPAAAAADAPTTAQLAQVSVPVPVSEPAPGAVPAGEAPAGAAPAMGAGEAGPGEAGTGEAGAEKQKRTQLTNVIGIDIPSSRCESHLRHTLGGDEIKRLREELKGAPAEQKEELKAQLDKKVKAGIRISNGAPVAVAVIWDTVVKELFSHGFAQAAASESKMLRVNHIQENSASLAYLGLYEKSQVWACPGAGKAEEEEAGDSAGEGAGAVKAPEEEEKKGRSSFLTYVDHALKTVRENKKLRISNEVREFIASLVSQGIANLGVLAEILVQKVDGARTMTVEHIMATAQLLLTNAGCPPGGFDSLSRRVEGCVGRYKEHISAEKKPRVPAAQDILARKQKMREKSLARATALSQEIATLSGGAA